VRGGAYCFPDTYKFSVEKENETKLVAVRAIHILNYTTVSLVFFAREIFTKTTSITPFIVA